MNDKLKHFLLGVAISLFFGTLLLDFLATALGSLLTFALLLVFTRI